MYVLMFYFKNAAQPYIFELFNDHKSETRMVPKISDGMKFEITAVCEELLFNNRIKLYTRILTHGIPTKPFQNSLNVAENTARMSLTDAFLMRNKFQSKTSQQPHCKYIDFLENRFLQTSHVALNVSCQLAVILISLHHLLNNYS